MHVMDPLAQGLRRREESRTSMHVLLAAWAPFHAGAEVAAVRLATGLRDAGHRVSVVVGTRGETYEQLREIGLDTRYLPLTMTDKFKWLRYRHAQRLLRRLLVELQPDVVHANDLPTSQMVAQATGRLGIPRVCHHRWIFGGSAIDWLNKYCAERHLFVSRALMDRLTEASPQLAASEREVVYDGLALPQSPDDDDRQAARRRLGLSLDANVVLFAGQIIERKGVADLLRAWTTVSSMLKKGAGAPARHQSPGAFFDGARATPYLQQTTCRCERPAQLIIAGDDLENLGSYRREMEALAQQLPCDARFVGYQRNVADWIVAADFCVVPSHEEPLGNATLEAMAHGRPVVGTHVGGIPEMVVHQETGLLVPPRNPERLADALLRLLSDADLRTRLGQSARARCEQLFSLRAHVDAVVAEYRQLLAERKV